MSGIHGPNSLQLTQRAGTVAPQATVTANSATAPNAYVVRFLGAMRHGAGGLYYPPSMTQNTIAKWDMVFRVQVGSGSVIEWSPCVFAAFNNCLVPASAFPVEVAAPLQRYLRECDAQERFYNMVSFFGIAKNTITYADGGALITASGTPRPNGQHAAVYVEGTMTIPCDSDWEIHPENKVMYAPPRFIPADALPAGHRFVARLAPLNAHTIKRLPEASYILYLNDLWSKAAGLLPSNVSANPSEKKDFKFVLGSAIGSKSSVTNNYVSDYAKTDLERCKLAAASAILILNAMGSITITTDGDKMDRALGKFVRSGNAGALVVLNDQSDFDSKVVSLRRFKVESQGGGRVKVVEDDDNEQTQDDLLGAIKMGALTPQAFANLLEKMGIVSNAKGTESEFTRQFSAIFATFMASGFVESALVDSSIYGGIPVRDTVKGQIKPSDVMGSFLTKLKSSSFETWQQSFTLFEKIQKRVVGIAQTGCPANPTGHIYREDDLNRRTIDIRLTAQRFC